jgi:hypothetical protein
MARVCDPSNARAPGTLCAHRNDALLMRASNSHSSCSHVAAVHEVFESQRLHRGKWMRTRHPEAFSAEDPAHWTNRIGEPTGDADADCLTPDEWASSSQAAPEGWEWVDQRWMVTPQALIFATACAHDTSLMFATDNHLFSERPPSEDEKALMQKAHEANVRGDAVTALFLFKECYQKTERFEARISVRSRCCNLWCDADCGPSVMPGAGR